MRRLNFRTQNQAGILFSRNGGYTLIEILGLMVILGIALATFVPMLFTSNTQAMDFERQVAYGIIKEQLSDYYSVYNHYPICIGKGMVVGAYWNDLQRDDLRGRRIHPEAYRYECYDGQSFKLSIVES